MAVKSKRNIVVSSGVIRKLGGGPPPPPMPADFPNKRSSGIFSAPKNAKSIDWTALNGNAMTSHWIRVTVNKCPVGAAKVAIAGPTAFFLDPKVSAHQEVPLPANHSDYYEVFFEDEDLNINPSVQLFRKYPDEVIEGSLIAPGDFGRAQA